MTFQPSPDETPSSFKKMLEKEGYTTEDKFLGGGSYGTVWLIKKEAKEYALKSVKITPSKRNALRLRLEIYISTNLKHVNLNLCHEDWDTEESHYMVVDYCNGGNIAAYCENKNDE